MKKLFLIIAISCHFAVNAKLWSVDNNPFSVADTTSLQGAINAASSGDSIVVMPSDVSYGTVSIAKKLFIYSSSHKPIDLSMDKFTQVSTVTISSAAAGTKLIGFTCSEGITINSSTCTVSNCELKRGIYLNGSNNLVIGNLISGHHSSSKAFVFFTTGSIANQIVHNYLSLRTATSNYDGTYSFFKEGDTSTLIANNFIVELVDGGGGISNGGTVFFNNSKSKVYNNILWSNVSNRTDFDTLHTGCTFTKNITYSANSAVDTLAGVNYNDTMPQFVGGYNNTQLPYYRTSNQLQLASASVGKNGGINGTDVGLYGNNFNYRMQGGNEYISLLKELTVKNLTVKQGQNLIIKLNITPAK